jgi:cytidyltransferase-like protein
MNIVLVTGGFDPLHSGHIAYFESAKQLGDKLIVGVNSDAWLERKKGRAFMPITERTTIIQNLRMVDGVILFNDDDGSSVEAVKNVQKLFPNDQIIFANGGDRTAGNIPEMACKDVIFKFGVGGDDKRNSSSWILEEWKAPKTERTWGYYRVLHKDGQQVKVKELTVNPGQRLSMQRHTDRAEHWFVSQGTATVNTLNTKSDVELLGEFDQFQHIHIDRTEWHQLCNLTEEPLKVVEIQYGPNCVEEDIERRSI